MEKEKPKLLQANSISFLGELKYVKKEETALTTSSLKLKSLRGH
jgi:hypothetical protein